MTADVRLPDGRRLAYRTWGPVDGRVVLFFSGAAMGSSLGFGTEVVDALGVRLVAVDRPGIGGSDPEPRRTLRSWPADVEQLVRHLDVDDVRIVAFSMGGPSALACAAAGVADAVALVSAQDDFAHAATAALLDPQVVQLVAAVAADPDAVEKSFAATATPEQLWTFVTEMSPPVDRELYTSLAFAAAYRRSLDEGFSQGASGYARDFVLAAGPWPFAVETITTPVELWYGEHDTSTVHSPDLGATLAQRLPDATRHVVAGVGGSVLWTHAEDILRSVVRPRP